MKINLNKQELNYLTIIIEQNLEKNNSFMNMLHDLYSKLIIMEDKSAKGGQVEIMLTDDDLGYYSILHNGEFIEKDFKSRKKAKDWISEDEKAKRNPNKFRKQ